MATDTKTTSSAHASRFLCDSLSFAAKEAFKRLRTNMTFALPENGGGCHTIGITSPMPSEGKSTIAVNLAYTLASSDNKVLIIDADLRRPSLHAKLGLEVTSGLTNLLSDSNKISESVVKYKSADGIGFDVIPAGEVPDSPSELLTSVRMRKLLAAVSTVYDYILVDLPPVGAVVDAISVGRNTDGMVIVVREKKCPTRAVDDCVEQLMRAGIRILGFALNGSEGSGKGYYKHNYYKYGYGYGYGYGDSYYGYGSKPKE